MIYKLTDQYRQKKLTDKLLENIRLISKKKIRIMEVCGTHTMSIYRHGINSLLPDTIKLISGPGCPVCVTSQDDIDIFIEAGNIENSIITSFGDLMRVPGSKSSLMKEKAKGKDIRIVNSPLDALKIAYENPDKQIIFLGIGFETTVPTIAASIIKAYEKKIDNYSIISSNKLVPPAVENLLEQKKTNIAGFLLPGHVSTIIGLNAYSNILKYNVPGVVAGFEPVDILAAILDLVENIEKNNTILKNDYPRAVNNYGNKKALDLIDKCYYISDINWRGLGQIKNSGLFIRDKYEQYNALKKFKISITKQPENKKCLCGDILMGVKEPPDCSLFQKGCTPENPIGPCMVSSEGTCAAFSKYRVLML